MITPRGVIQDMKSLENNESNLSFSDTSAVIGPSSTQDENEDLPQMKNSKGDTNKAADGLLDISKRLLSKANVRDKAKAPQTNIFEGTPSNGGAGGPTPAESHAKKRPPLLLDMNILTDAFMTEVKKGVAAFCQKLKFIPFDKYKDGYILLC